MPSIQAPIVAAPGTTIGNGIAPAAYQLTPTRRNRGVVFFTLFGVFLPFASIAIEVFLRGCSETLLDPLPTVWHGLCATTVPLFNAIIFWQTMQEPTGRPRLLRFLNAVALGSAIYFCITFLPVLPIGIIGILAMGLGLLVLGPYFGLMAAFKCRRRLRESATGSQIKVRWSLLVSLVGFVLPLAVLGAHDVRRAMTLQKLGVVGGSAAPADQASAIASLRQWGDEQAMLDACFGRGRHEFMPHGWRRLTDPADVNAVQAASAYYRVTGKVSDEQARVHDWRPVDRQSRSREWEQWQEDFRRGGEEVGPVLPGLNLNASAITGTIHSDAAAFYSEWVLEFRNDTFDQQEARCRILLPEGGVVSRVTLWINGEEREAAYGPRTKVREAYQSVAVVQRRDPVLVTSSGSNRVMLQCFPVPAKGTMKTKIGISAPLRLNAAADRGLVTLPCLLEQNFSFPGQGQQPIHNVSIESGQPLQFGDWLHVSSEVSGSLRTVSGRNADGAARYEMNGLLRNDLLWSRIAISAVRRADRAVAYAEDPFDTQKRVVVQTITPTTRPAAKLTVVVDGSAAMAPHWEPICNAVSGTQIAQGVIAADQIIETPGTAQSSATLAAALRAYTPVGGQDAVPALNRALDLAGPDGVILWVHAAQPVLLESTASLEARLSARRNIRVIEVNVGTGGNRVADALAQENLLETTPWAGSLSQTLSNAIAAEASPRNELRLQRELKQAAPTDPNAVHGNINLVRLWAATEVDRLVRGGATLDRDAATKLAIGHQLVTPVSGAVVLETKAQYDQNDLKPVTAVPLPPAVLAMLAMIPFIYFARRRLIRVNNN